MNDWAAVDEQHIMGLCALMFSSMMSGKFRSLEDDDCNNEIAFGGMHLPNIKRCR